MPRRRTAHALLACLGSLAAAQPAAAEDWPGLYGNGPHLNASGVDVPPEGLGVAWHRAFDRVHHYRSADGPQDERHLSASKGSRNLALVDGRLALLAADGDELPAGHRLHYATILSAEDGRTQNVIQVETNVGNTRVYVWPHATVSASADTLTGQVVTYWDPQTRILFTGQGGYESAYSAYLPLANLATWGGGGYQEGVPAYAAQAAEHPGYADAFGRTRGDLITYFGVQSRRDEYQPHAWGPGLIRVDPAEEKRRIDTDWTSIGSTGLHWYNLTANLYADPERSLIGIGKSHRAGHTPAGVPYLYQKHTGLKAIDRFPAMDASLAPAGAKSLAVQPFAHHGTRIANGRVFFAGPGEDRDGNGWLADRRVERGAGELDQGLALWAFDVSMEDRQPNGGLEGPAAAETAVFTPAFAYRFPSRLSGDWAESWLEGDGFYRPKAFLVDGAGVWYAWKPGGAEPVELIHATDEGAKVYSLGVGNRAIGPDLWPKLSLVERGDARRLVYFTGYARHRDRYVPEDPEAALRERHDDWESLDAEARAKRVRGLRSTGWWTEELLPPRNPAQLAVFDAAAGETAWTFDLSAAWPDLPANGFWTYLDRAQMVAAGRWVYVGWVGREGDAAVLRLVAFDAWADRPAPVERVIPLGFPAATAEGSALIDLIAADGRLFALVVEADGYEARDPRFRAQHVIALAPSEAAP